MSKIIKRDWRNWKPQQTPSGKRPTPGFDSFQSLGGGGDKNTKAVKPKIDKKKVLNDKLQIKSIKNKNFTKSKASRTKLYGNKSTLKNKNFNFKAQNMSEDRLEYLLDSYEQNRDWSHNIIRAEKAEYKRNKDRAPNIMTKANATRDRRLSSSLAVIISKLAEDKTGEPIIGEDEWDVQELMMRSITRRNIYHCMQSRERENIVLVLDSSPSCERSAKLYGQIAYLSCKLGNLDIYLAPNARLTHKMNAKTHEYENIFSMPEDKNLIACQMDSLHNFFRNRVILFFGDYDGVRHICLASHNNEVYWLNNDYEDEYEHENHLCDRKFNGTVFQVNDRKDLINVIRKLR